MHHRQPVKTILLVEDEAIIAMNEEDILAKDGFKVKTVHTAEKAIEAVKAEQIDLVLMDINLGEGMMEGTAAAEIILSEQELPIVFLTSHTEKEMVEKVKDITRYGYVLKNAGEFVLIESITMAFELFYAHRALQKENQERKTAERNLQETAALYSHLMENSIDAVYLLSRAGKVLNVNKVACEMIGYTKDELLTLTIDDIDPNYPSQKFAEFWENKPEGSTILFESLHKHKNGEIIPVEVNGIFFLLEGAKYLFGVARDIRTRKKDKEALLNSEEKYKRIFNNSPYLIMEVDADTYEILSCNPAMAEKFGSVPKQIEGQNIADVLPPAVFEKRKMHGLKALESGEIVQFNDERNGKQYQNMFIPIVTNERRIVQTISIDITDYVLAEQRVREKEQNFRSLAENAGVGITLIQNDEIIYVNQTAGQISGYQIDEMLSMGIQKMIEHIHPDDRAYVAGLYKRQSLAFISAGEEKISFPPIEYRHLRVDGAVVWTEAYTSMIRYNGEPAFLVFHHDITGRKNIEEKLSRALEQKNELMRELNHRVKNNLLMVSSLIELKDDDLGDTADLSELQHQIDAVRILHENLYDSEEIHQINLREYVRDLISIMFSAFSRKHVSVKNGVDELTLPAKRAVPLGLIINEIATNAIKYGFTDNDDAEFAIEMKKDPIEDQYVFTISNTGKPFPEEIELDNPETSGLRLITALVSQLEGTIELQRVPYPVFTIRFPVSS